MIYLYGQLFENIENEKNLFERKSNSPEYEEFYSKVLKIIQDIVKDELNINQKRLLLLFLQNKSKYTIAKILNINNSTVHQNFNLIIKKISIKLIGNKNFLDLIDQVPQYIRENLLSWIEESIEKFNLKPYVCPICNEKFANKYEIKKHILKINDTNHLKYYNDQIEFIRHKLNKCGFNVRWIYQQQDNLLFSISWIYNLWKKEYKNNLFFNLKNIFRIKRKCQQP